MCVQSNVLFSGSLNSHIWIDRILRKYTIYDLTILQIAYLCIEWARLGESNPMQRFTLIIFILLILLFNIQIGLTEANVDNLGHLGGLIVGIIMGFAIAENDDRRERA